MSKDEKRQKSDNGSGDAMTPASTAGSEPAEEEHQPAGLEPEAADSGEAGAGAEVERMRPTRSPTGSGPVIGAGDAAVARGPTIPHLKPTPPEADLPGWVIPVGITLILFLIYHFSAVNGLSSQIEMLRARQANLERQNLDDRLRTVGVEVGDLTPRVATNETRMERLLSLPQKVTRLEMALQATDNAYEKADTELANRLEKAEALQQEAATGRAGLAQTDRMLEKKQSGLEGIQNRLASRTQALEGEVEDLRREVALVSDGVAKLEQGLEGEVAVQKELRDSYERLRATDVKLAETINDLSVAQQRADIAAAQKGKVLEEHSARMADVKQAQAELSDAVGRLREELQKVRALAEQTGAVSARQVEEMTGAFRQQLDEARSNARQALRESLQASEQVTVGQRLRGYQLPLLDGESTLVRALTAALQDPEPLVRSTAAGLLGDVGKGAKSALPALEKLREDPDMEVRAAARNAIDRIGQAD